MRATLIFFSIFVILILGIPSLAQDQEVYSTFEAEPDRWGRTPYSYSNMGAWHSYALPPQINDTIGFYGPWLMTEQNGVHFAKWFGAAVFTRNGKNVFDSASTVHSRRSLWALNFVIENDSVEVWANLSFISANETDIIYDVISKDGVPVDVELVGKVEMPKCTSDTSTYGFVVFTPDSLTRVEALVGNTDTTSFSFDKSTFSRKINQLNHGVNSGHSYTLMIKNKVDFADNISPMFEYDIRNDTVDFNIIPTMYFRYQDYHISDRFLDYPKYEELYKKCIATLVSNWRSAAGELKHDGIFPSHHEYWFHGMWAWDSWKHAVGIVKFDEELAKDQIRAMLDYQNDNGMIADCIFRDTLTEKHNWRNSKPPLLAWAVNEIYQATNDTDFVREVMPAVFRYHKFWRTQRANPYNPEYLSYGSQDSSITPAKWESGMDNAVRFDDASLVPTPHGNYVLDQASVDLYCFLQFDFNNIVELMHSCDLKSIPYIDPATLESKASLFFDQNSGWFYDLRILKDGSTKPIKTVGPEGWIPLFTSMASDEQAAAVVKKLTDSNHFNSTVPFPTLSLSDPKLDPEGGYWRGPVWIDQAYFAIKGLRNYGYNQLADEMTIKLISNCEGMLGSNAPLRENYNPISGEGLNAKHFSWTAACLLLLLNDLNLESIPK